MDKFREYEVWHDENKNNGYWHGILLVPLNKKHRLISILKKIREEHKYSSNAVIKFCGIHGSKKISAFVENELHLFSHIVKTKIDIPCKLFRVTRQDKYRREYNPYLTIFDSLECRFGLLKIEDNLSSFNNLKYAQKIELTFDFLIRSCLHTFFDSANMVEVVRFHFDGFEHHRSNINLDRIFRANIRDYVKIRYPVDVDDRQRNERLDDSGIMIDFIDHVVGAFQKIIDLNEIHRKVFSPLSDIYTRAVDGLIIKNRNSSWYNSISLNELTIIDEQINFPNILRNDNQLSFL